MTEEEKKERVKRLLEEWDQAIQTFRAQRQEYWEKVEARLEKKYLANQKKRRLQLQRLLDQD